MNAVSPAADLQAEFISLLESAADAHASQVYIRLAGDRAQVVANPAGQEVQVAEWPTARCEAFLSAVFAMCDKADAYSYGQSRSMQMTGERVALPAAIRTVLVQFFPPKDGGRHMVARITRAGDICCGTCGG